MLERVLEIDDKVRCEAGWLTFANTAEEVSGHKFRIKLDSKNQKTTTLCRDLAKEISNRLCIKCWK